MNKILENKKNLLQLKSLDTLRIAAVAMAKVATSDPHVKQAKPEDYAKE